MKTIPLKHQCKSCDGNGHFIYDSHDYNGEHVQREETCRECDGTGINPKYKEK